MSNAYDDNRVLGVKRGKLVYLKLCPDCGHTSHEKPRKGKDKYTCLGIDYGHNGKEPGPCMCTYYSPPLKQVKW